jgi:hypothetical protein
VNTLENTSPVIPTPILPTIKATPLVNLITATPSAQAQLIFISTPLDWAGEGNNTSFVPEPVNHNIKPTADLRQIITVTPSKPEQCPSEKPNLVFNEEVLDNSLPYVDNEMAVLDFINSGGGTPRAVIEALFREMEISGYYLNQDLTGDGIPELAITYAGYLYIFGCKSGKYVTTLKIRNAISGFPIFIGPVKDLNLNGIPEIVLSTTTCNSPCTEVRIFEWDGNQYRSLLRTQFYGYLFDYAQIYNGTISIQDLDGNGFIEMVLDGGIPTQMAALVNGFPFRRETQIFFWKGMVFEQTSQEYDPPQYRFQAVQDGDRASLAGEYDKAIAYYQQAIFSNELDWWSAERRQFIRLYRK